MTPKHHSILIMIEKYRIQSLNKRNCKEAAVLRFEDQESGFLPSMGMKFYTELLKATCDSKWGFGIVCKDNNETTAGFICACIDLKKYYRDVIIRRGIILSFWAFLKLLRHPNLIIGLFQHLNNHTRGFYNDVKAEWLIMVVERNYRGTGIGKKLTSSLIYEYKKRGIKKFNSTVRSENKISCHIHEKFGFQFIGTFESHDEKMNRYRYNIFNG